MSLDVPVAESYAPDGALSLEQRRALSEKRGDKSARRLVAQLVLAGATFVLGWFAWGTVWFWPAVALHGLTQVGFFGAMHEAGHLTAFSSRGGNVLAGWVASLFQLMSPALFRAFHFAHHRHTHELEHDPELAGMKMMMGWPRHVVWLVTISGLPILMARSGWMVFAAITPPFADKAWEAVLPFVRKEQRSLIGREARLLLLVHAAIIAAAVLLEPRLYVFLLGLVFGHAFLSLHITCEHRGLPDEGNIFDKTRSIAAPAPWRWLLWNMSYHAEHHAWPHIPWHRLGEVHALVKDRLPHKDSGIVGLHLRHGRDKAVAQISA